MNTRRIFCFYWKQIGFHSIGIGVNVDLSDWRLELHLPGGYLAIGFHKVTRNLPLNWMHCTENETGWGRFRHVAINPLADSDWGAGGF